jgi:energy-coupling factor transport system ATP-binding protein
VSWEGVSHDYGQGEVVRDVWLSVGTGESVALLGPNGAGKTTLARMLVGLVRPQQGRVLVGDWEAASKRPEQMARRVGLAFQHADHQLFARTVRRDVGFGPRRLGLGEERVPALLAELGLEAHADRHPYDLTPPLRKLVAVAGVLAMQTPVLVMDEPTAGFDRSLRELVTAALRRRLERGATLILISHDVALVRAVARREVVLERGRIVKDRPAA